MEESDYKMIGSPALSDQGKMVIKLNFPKLERDIENESKNEDQDGEAGLMMMKKMPNVRVCQECKKEFSSGKALGGHMRVHAIHQSSNSTTTTNFNNKQNPNSSNSSSSKKVKKDFKVAVNNKKKPLAAAVKKPYYLDSVNNEGKPMCSQCGKTFPSMKSLFGHMRCHPERVWRGILPPPNINGLVKPAANNNNNNVVVSGSSSSNSLLSINNDNDDDEKKLVDLTQFLRGWGVTEKRGRPSLKRFNSDDDESDEDEDGVLLEAVEDLMSLAKGNNDNFVTTKFEGSSSSTFVNRKGVNLELENDDDGDQFDGYKMMNSTYNNVAYKSNGVYNKMKKRKKMKLMMELELEEPQIVGDNECKYKCTTCNKCFNSHQALGGHRSSHNKSNKIIHDHHQDYYESNIVVMDDDDDQKAELAAIAAAHQFAAGDHHHYSSVISSSVVVHQCKICDKVFPTGQALGGHKRCHWTGLTEPAQAPSSQITSAGEGGGGGGGSQSASGCRKVLDFDLNEIPVHIPLEEDGITIGLGNEYASSSYNSNMG